MVEGDVEVEGRGEGGGLFIADSLRQSLLLTPL